MKVDIKTQIFYEDVDTYLFVSQFFKKLRYV